MSEGLLPDARQSQRRGRGRPKGGRRLSDPILDLETHPAPFVCVWQLSQYWGFSVRTIQHWIVAGKLPALRAGEYRIRRVDAIAHERVLFSPRKPDNPT